MIGNARADAASAHGDGVVRRLLDRCLNVRDRLLASPKFQSRAAAFAPTRFVARRRADDLFNLCAGFVYSQVLAACVELRLFEILLKQPVDLKALSEKIEVPIEACRRLVEAACALRLLQRRGGDRYGLGPLGAAMVENHGLNAMIEHHRHFYFDIRDPVALLRGRQGETQLAKYWPYADASRPAELKADDVAGYSSLMALSQPIVAEEVLDAFPLGGFRRLMDVGGGEGAFLAEAAARHPHLQLMLFDLPAVVERGDANFKNLGVADRSTVFGGDFFAEPLPKGADVISLVRVVLDHDDQKVLKLLQSVHAALDDGGTLLIAEPLPQSGGYEPMASAYFGFYLMAMGRGRVRTKNEFAQLLTRAGFRSISFRTGRRILRTGLVIARR